VSECVMCVYNVHYTHNSILSFFVHENSVGLHVSSTANPKPKGQPSHCLLQPEQAIGWLPLRFGIGCNLLRDKFSCILVI
jgi:hypothetical protein